MRPRVYVVLPLALGVAFGILLPGCAAGRAEPGPFHEARARRHLQDGIALVRGERDPSAGIDALRLAIAGAPPSAIDLRVEAHRWIGHARSSAGDPEGALTEYRLALTEAPGDVWLHYASGISWNTMGDLERALACFTRALELDPRHIKALQWRGELHHVLGDERSALADLTNAYAAIQRAEEVELTAWGGDRRQLQLMTLGLCIEVRNALADVEGANQDRSRREALLAEGVDGSRVP